MKAILMSIRPQWVAKILNGEKTVEIRKKFPKDYVGWVYIYCTKKDSLGRIKDTPRDRYFVDCVETPQDFKKMDSGYDGKGKVVAKFTLNKVEPIAQYDGNEERYFTKSLWETELFEKSCLGLEEMRNYIHNHCGYAIHITNLEIFDKPKEISEFTYWKDYGDCKQTMKLTRAPQSWCWIEV